MEAAFAGGDENLKQMQKPRQTFIIHASSSGFEGANDSEITINGEKVVMQLNENGNLRGLHLAVIDPEDGHVALASVFDTYKSSCALDNFIDEGIPDGYIVVATCKDDCTSALSQKAKTWLSQLGSKEIAKVEYRQAFAFIGKVGTHAAANERRATSAQG